MSNRKAIGVLAGIVLVLGLILGTISTSVSGDVGCGSAFSPESKPGVTENFGEALRDIYAGGNGDDVTDFDALCSDRISTQRLIAFPAMGIGALGLLFLLLTAPVELRAAADAEADEDDSEQPA